MDWNDVVTQLRGSWTVVTIEPEWCGLELVVEGKRRKVIVHRAPTAPALILAAHVCAAQHIAPCEAVAYNGRRKSWALTLFDGGYLLRRTLPLVKLAAHELDHAISAIAVEAARLHRRHVPAREPSLMRPLLS